MNLRSTCLDRHNEASFNFLCFPLCPFTIFPPFSFYIFSLFCNPSHENVYPIDKVSPARAVRSGYSRPTSYRISFAIMAQGLLSLVTHEWNLFAWIFTPCFSFLIVTDKLATNRLSPLTRSRVSRSAITFVYLFRIYTRFSPFMRKFFHAVNCDIIYAMIFVNLRDLNLLQKYIVDIDLNVCPRQTFFVWSYQHFIYEASSLQIKWQRIGNDRSNLTRNFVDNVCLFNMWYRLNSKSSTVHCGFARTSKLISYRKNNIL